jgi:hypothetical protein
MHIRPQTESEVGPFRALRDHPDAFGASYEEGLARPLSVDLDQIRAAAASPDDRILGAFAGERDDKMVGMVDFKRESGAKFRHRGYIWGITPRRRRAARG